MRVPFIDICAQNRSIAGELEQAVGRVIRDGSFILGPQVQQFEHSLAQFVGVDYCVGLNSGTSAIHLALTAHDVGPSDEVITTPHTWISTVWGISYVGATPVFADIDPQTYTIDTQSVRKAITPATKAILPVHLYGQAADVVELRELADERSLVLIEDAAQAHGAIVSDRRIGSFGDAACFSFYPSKNLGAFGEAGAVLTNNASVAERIRRLRDHAQVERHRHAELGFNARMDAIQAAVLDVKLRHLDRWNEMRRQHAQQYTHLLSGVDAIELPNASTAEAHVWHLFVVLLKNAQRDDVRAALQQHGVDTAVHYPTPVPYQPVYASRGHQPGDFPVAEDVMQRCLSLPMFPEMTSQQVAHVAKALKIVVSSQSEERPAPDS